MPSFFRSFLFFDRRPLSGPPAGPLYFSRGMEGRGPRGTQARGRAAALAPETPVEKTPALSRRALVARRPRPKSARGASSLRRPRNQDADRCGQSVLVSGLAPSNHFLASLGSVTNPLRLIRYPGRKTPADRCGWFAFRVAPPRRPPAPPQLRSACRAVWRPPAPLLGTSKAFHPVGRAHGLYLVWRTRADTWNVAAGQAKSRYHRYYIC